MMVMWDDSKDDNNERRHGNAHHRYYFLNPKSHNETKIEKLSETTKKKKDTSQKLPQNLCFETASFFKYRAIPLSSFHLGRFPIAQLPDSLPLAA